MTKVPTSPPEMKLEFKVSFHVLSGGDDGDAQVLRHATAIDLLDEKVLIMEAREGARRRHHFLFPVFVVLIPITLTACAVQYPQGVSASPSPTMALICQSARVKLLDVTAIPGGMGHGGVVVRASVTSPSECTMSGYSIVGVELSNHSTAMASNERYDYLGGFENATAPLPQISVTSRSQVVSFTIQSTSFGDPPTCPQIITFKVKLPGSRDLLTARSMYEAPMGLIQGRGLGFYCGNLQVTPLIKGSSGSGG